MSRPTSSASTNRMSGPSSNMMGGEAMGRVHTFSPTPSASSSHQQQIYYTPQDHIVTNSFMQQFGGAYRGEIHGHMIAPYAGHQVAQGRMAIPMVGQPGNVIAINPGRAGKTPIRATPPPNGFEDLGPSPFLPEEDSTPFMPAHFDSYGQLSQSPSIGMGMQLPPNQLVSPTEHMNMARMGPQLHRSNTMPLISHQQQYQPLQPGRQRMPAQQARPSMTHRQTMTGPIQRPVPLSRHASLQAPMRSTSPHIAGDMFDPVPPGASGSPVMRQQMQQLPPPPEAIDMSWDLSSFDHSFGLNVQGISPARALGPAPQFPQRFSPHREIHVITPQGNKSNYPENIHSSSTSVATTATASSSISSLSDICVRSTRQHVKRPEEVESSDDENDSPTRGPSTSRAMLKMHLEEKKPVPAIAKPPRPPSKVGQGGRTSAKFAKVAEDPGVEGIPPGPRPMERPNPSFACIIGQAILRCKAGGLSLEHIYRYVETAYPFFKTGDGAWRNSVRHNLSIHKMFETIPRTEAFPPGKGGIWIIHEEEKCHWPAEDKFIKNFPPSHPHHAVCRQTMHEKAKEKEAMEKAAREGRVYVPKKGKKGRKLANKDDDDDDAIDMIRTSSMLTEVPLPLERSLSQQQQQAGSSTPIAEDNSTTPKMKTTLMEPPPIKALDMTDGFELEEDEGEFLPIDLAEDAEMMPPPVDVTPIDPAKKREEQLAGNGVMIPPRFERKEKRRPLIVDDDNVFTSATKRVRVAEPLAPIHPIPQETATIQELDDSFITPERERPSSSNNSKLMSSAFKTPALIQTSSSPGSSPMPQTITRSTHHPSALQQAWTHDDMTKSPARDSSPARPMLDAAFDFKPKAPPPRTRTLAHHDDDFVVPSNNISHSPRAPPKTPVTRSSAATDKNKTPRLQHLRTPSLAKTPMFFGGSPALPPPSASALLSTPMWEVGGVLDRLKDHLTGSPTHSSIRSPMPPTSPTRYAMLLDSGGSPRKRRDVSL
ncbi:hypothetical protein I317_04536 [Kwoniella heveanensis CBS 569]|nr:hypothetical protein I317_04536 [Kwoniella heveanensis CBS 569]